MRVLTDLQRRFVLAQASDPFGTATGWARKAGFSEKNPGALRVRAHEMAHNPKVQAAVFEFAASDLMTFGPILATTGLLQAARNRKHPAHMKALLALANRVGFHEKTEHKVSVHHTDDAGSIEGRIRQLAERLGIDPERLLGGGLPAKPPALIDITPEKPSE